MLTLIALKSDTLRFSVLRRKVNGVSERMLAQTLQQLEGDGLVIRRSYPRVPPHVEYTLTPFGQEAASHVEAIANWIEDQLPALVRKSDAQHTQDVISSEQGAHGDSSALTSPKI